jgi:putative DNA methylase
MSDIPRLIEHAFPLKQTSLDSVHEKNVRHGHISTLHIWPARRPLAACRAALIATLLPDPSTQPKPESLSDEEWHKEIVRRRKELCEKIGGKVVKKIERKKMPNGQIVEREKEITEGGILHWKRETENKQTLEWFRQEIRKAYGGRAPKVLDPFAGGGAIPLEAMRLGCEATAVDINPVAWFILKCTLEYPQKVAGITHPLPDFILENEEFMTAFYKAHPHLAGRTKRTKKQQLEFAQNLFMKDKPDSGRIPKADLAWHVRAWGQWVLIQARRELAQFYPTYADFEPLERTNQKSYEKQPMRLAPLKEDGTADIEALNSEFSNEYLSDKRNPRWIAKPTIAYLWARTVTCKNCRATIPLLKTRWLCKREKKRVVLTVEPNSDKSGVAFGIDANVPMRGGNTAQRREHDKRMGVGTMSKSGAKCPCCGLPSMTMDDIQIESVAGRAGFQMTAIVTEGQKSKEYRQPTPYEIAIAANTSSQFEVALAGIPNATITDPFSPCSTRSISAQLYGIRKWIDLYTSRQALAIAQIGKAIHEAHDQMKKTDYLPEWPSLLAHYLCLGLDRLVCFMCVNVRWKTGADSMTDAFSRFSISLLWDFVEAQPLGTAAGSYIRCNERIATALDLLILGVQTESEPRIVNDSATDLIANDKFDAIVTDPPYYQAVSYADLSDFSYTWLRGFVPELPKEFHERLTNKSGEAVQHVREDKDRMVEKMKYENQMAAAFVKAKESMSAEGRFVCVFAHKEPDAWETLASAIIRAGFVVSGSWPIQTEMPSRQRASSTAALSSSVWIVAKPRPADARPGWDNQVLEEMRQNIREKLRDFWDAGIRGPDFVWAATGPALEAFSKHPVVKKANEPGTMTVSEFLNHVRRMVVDFVVGRVLSGDKGDGTDLAAADRLDEPTAYYLLHRHDFGMDEAPAGACILYAISCGISDKDLAGTWDLISFTKGKSADEAEDEEPDADAESDPDAEEDSGSKVKLKTWAQRKNRSLGYEAPGGKPIPLIDRIHCMMHLWRGGDLSKVDEYLDSNGLRRQELFKRLLQSLIELSPHGSEERSLLESLSNHVQARGAAREAPQAILPLQNEES